MWPKNSQGTGQVMKVMKEVTDVYYSTKLHWNWRSYLRNHMIDDWEINLNYGGSSNLSLTLLSCPSWSYLTFRTRDSGIATQVISHQVAHNSSKRRESFFYRYVCMSSCRAGHIMEGPNRRIHKIIQSWRLSWTWNPSATIHVLTINW